MIIHSAKIAPTEVRGHWTVPDGHLVVVNAWGVTTRSFAANIICIAGVKVLTAGQCNFSSSAIVAPDLSGSAKRWIGLCSYEIFRTKNVSSHVFIWKRRSLTNLTVRSNVCSLNNYALKKIDNYLMYLCIFTETGITSVFITTNNTVFIRIIRELEWSLVS